MEGPRRGDRCFPQGAQGSRLHACADRQQCLRRSGGGVIFQTIKSSVDESVVVLAVDDPILVNALQRRAAVVLQKSIREGFGLTVTEDMWKDAAVIGGNVGGIRRQIIDGENGFLVTSPDQAAERIVQILKDKGLRERLGSQAKESVRERFLMSR